MTVISLFLQLVVILDELNITSFSEPRTNYHQRLSCKTEVKIQVNAIIEHLTTKREMYDCDQTVFIPVWSPVITLNDESKCVNDI